MHSSHICSVTLKIYILLQLRYSMGVEEIPFKQYSSYRKYPVCNPSEYIRNPKTTDDVISIVQEAINNKKTVKAFGARHSQTDIICTDGIPVDTHGLNTMKLNPDNTATFGSGVILYDATKFLKENGRAFKTTPAFGNITLGGAVGTGAHGSTTKYLSSISSQVTGMTIVDGTATVRTISSKDDLKAFKVHLGLLGFIVDITIATEPLYKVNAYNKVTPDDILTDLTKLKALINNADQISLYWFPFQRELVVAEWTIVDVNTPGSAHTYDHVPSTIYEFNAIVKTAGEVIQQAAERIDCPSVSAAGYSVLHFFENYFKSTLYQTTPLFVPIYTYDDVKVVNPAVGYYDVMFAPTCRDDGKTVLQCVYAHPPFNGTILDYEFTFPIDKLPQFIKVVRDIISKVPAAFPLQGILMRFSKASDIYMSTAYGQDDVVHFEYYLIHRVDTYNDPSASLAAYQAIIQVAVSKFNARAHWGKNGLAFHSKDMIEMKLDREAKDGFIDVMDKYDPNGVFMNDFGKRLKGESDKIDVDPKVTKCGLLDNCICDDDSDCGDIQYCGSVPGYDVSVCRTHNDEKVIELVVVSDVGIDESFDLKKYVEQVTKVVKGLLELATCPVDGLVGLGI